MQYFQYNKLNHMFKLVYAIYWRNYPESKYQVFEACNKYEWENRGNFF